MLRVTFEIYNFAVWERLTREAISLDYDRTDAHMLTIRSPIDGRTIHYNPVRNITVHSH